MTHSFRWAARRVFAAAGLPAAALLLATAIVAPAQAHVSLRVEGRPATAPIQAFVRVTDSVACRLRD